MKIDRLLAIVFILLEHEVISAGALARKLEVSRRTVYRDIEALTMAGLPVFTTQGATGGVGLMSAFKMDKKLFTPKDVQALATSLESYKQLFGHKDILHALEKLNSLRSESGAGVGIESRVGAGGFVADLALNRGNRKLRALLSLLETAMNERRYLEFGYMDKDGKATSRRVEPYRVVFKESKWYVQAYCVDREAYRIFKLSRMSGLCVMAETFAARPFTPMAMDGTDWMSGNRVTVTLRLALSVKDQVIERFGEDHILRVEEDHCLALYEIVNDASGYDVLLRFGDKCEVLEPTEVREAFGAYVRKIAARYEEMRE
ncbi:helix-turn-helix transcriptional regulator [Paenibacillus koleovorans]|uniref:helix-turn-helix transcriptional regulator n=1 Tax=Paenibacillus koleovorans TaxID=121608 RepID=UPI000FD97102|nr:YafY family protein [Paenibacillus koleovorans]